MKYTEEELEATSTKDIRAIARELKIKNPNGFKKADLIKEILRTEEKRENTLCKSDESSDFDESVLDCENSLALEEFEPDENIIIDEETGEVLEKEPEKEEKKDQTPVRKLVKSETQQGKQLSLKLDGEPKKKKTEQKIEEKPVPEENLEEQRRVLMEKYRKDNGYTSSKDKKTKARKEIGGERLTKIMIVVVPIATLLGIYCGLEAIIFAISKLWYGNLAYVPVNLPLKTILCITSIAVLEFSKYAQQFDKVIDYYAERLKRKTSDDEDSKK